MRALLVAALITSFTAFAQSPAELAEWVRGLNGKINSQAPTPELVAKAYSVSFDSAKDKVPPDQLAKLKGFAQLREVGLGNKAASDEGVAAIVKAVPTLETLNVSFSKNITDAAFVEIAKLSKLKELKAIDTAITPAAMKSIAGLKDLKRLDISKTKIGDEGLEAIKGMGIANLWFNDMRGVTKTGMAAIAAMPELTNLVLQFADINAEVEELAKSKKLKDVTFMSSKLDDAGGVQLAKVKTLENLFLWSTKVTDKTMEAISTLNLKVLYVSNTPVTDAGLKSLAKIKSLETVWVDRTGITDVGINAFAAHPKLRWIAADETKVTDACVPTLVALPAFATFSARKTAFTDAGIGKLKEKFPKGHFSK